MAIQQVGGQGVYVITGSGRDPRKTSNGQSWADLVTKQKYMLYKAAYDQAMREYESGQISNEERQRKIELLRKEIGKERAEIARLERKQLTENDRRERLRKRTELELATQTVRTPQTSQTTQTREGTKVVDTGIPLKEEYRKDLVQEEGQARTQNQRAFTKVQRIKADDDFARALKKKAQNQPLIGMNLAAYNANIETYTEALNDYNKTQTRLEDLQTKIDELDDYDTQEAFETYYKDNVLFGADPSVVETKLRGRGSGQTVTSKQVTPGTALGLEDVDYSEFIETGRDRIGDIEKQILELESEKEDPTNVIRRTKEIGRDELGIGQPRQRRRLFGRRAEMEALGMEPEPNEETVETAQETVDVTEPVTENMEGEGQIIDRDVQLPTAQRYTVKEGDTLSGISQRYYNDPQRFTDIAEASGIENPDRISVGQELIIPLDQPVPTEEVEQPYIRPEAAQPAPAPTQQIVEDNVDVGPNLKGRATQEEIDRINNFLRTPLDTATPAPAPAPTGLSTVKRLGKLTSYKETMDAKANRGRRSLPPIQQIRAAFDPVRNLDRRQKQQVGLLLLQQAKQAYGVSSPEYKKAKEQILSELQKAVDPKKAQQMNVVKKLQETMPTQYAKVGDDIRGLSSESKRMVVQLFPINTDSKLDEIEKLYTNAQQQLKLSVVDKGQKKKALNMLDLMYLAVVSDKR